MDIEIQQALKRINEAVKRSKCSICGSEAYGRGCIYGPGGRHLHLDDLTRCSWCGSKTISGRGCIYSPTGYHGIGSNLYTNMPTESFITSYFLKKLKTPFSDTKAYETGVINESGQLIKKPETDEEKASYTPFDSFIFKIKRLLKEKIDFINDSLFLEMVNNSISENSTIEVFEEELKLKRKLETIAKEFYSNIEEARDKKISEAVIDKIVLETFSR